MWAFALQPRSAQNARSSLRSFEPHRASERIAGSSGLTRQPDVEERYKFQLFVLLPAAFAVDLATAPEALCGAQQAQKFLRRLGSDLVGKVAMLDSHRSMSLRNENGASRSRRSRPGESRYLLVGRADRHFGTLSGARSGAVASRLTVCEAGRPIRCQESLSSESPSAEG